MPSGERRKEYLYETCDLLPPLGEKYMAHLFCNPEHSNDQSLTYLRVPKKRREKLKVCQQQQAGLGWGVHLVEGCLFSRVMILVTGSLAFGVCSSILKHDVPGGFAVTGWILALAIVLASAQLVES